MSRSISTEDRISSLPDPIISHILSFVPTKTAATTSILSKRWNPLWLSVLVLHFDDQTFQNLESFCHFVSFVFLVRDITLPLRSFHLKCSNASIQPQDINGFVHAAAKRGIENLNLEMPGMVTLPRSIVHCKTLVVLHLKGLNISHGVLDFPLLKTLHLSSVLFQRFEYLVEILSGCPILEELQAEDLSVDNVEWLFIQENSVIAKKFLSLLPNLIRASITKSPSYLTNLVALLCTEAQVLRAEFNMIIGNINPFRNLTNIELIIKHNHRHKWKWLLGMLKHSPKLQHFTVHEDVENGEEVVDNWVDPANIPECLSTQLKTCLLKGYKCTECELQFAKYIMQNSKVLKIMSIKSASSVDTNAKHQILMKLASWTRASSACKLLFD